MIKNIFCVYFDNDIWNRFVDEKCNTLIEYNKSNKKHIFKSRYRISSEEIHIIRTQITSEQIYNCSFEKVLESYITLAYQKAETISKEPLDDSKTSNIYNKLKTPIFSFIYRTNYELTESQNRFDIFDFFTNIFLLFLEGHCLDNGNKRFAFCYLVFIMFDLGYYFKYTKGSWNNYSLYSKKIKWFAKEIKKHTTTFLDYNDSFRHVVKQWIYDNSICFSLNFHFNYNHLAKWLIDQKLLLDHKLKYNDPFINKENPEQSKFLKKIVFDLRKY